MGVAGVGVRSLGRNRRGGRSTGTTLERLFPSANERLRQWIAHSRRLQASPAVGRALYEAFSRIDVRPVLSLIQCPVLVLQRTDSYAVRVGHGRYLAEHIANAKYVELPGGDSAWWVGDTGAIVDEVEDFLTGARPTHESDRVLATVMFTDMVQSTERMAELGDRRWRGLVDEYESAVRREIDRFRGRYVNTTGDGTLATFDGPARAIRCAAAIADSARNLGIELRAGLHTGEIGTARRRCRGYRRQYRSARGGARWTERRLGLTHGR